MTFSQKKQKVAIYDPEKIELKENTKFIGKDTLFIHQYENGKILSKGKYAITKSGSNSNLKVGFWVQYYRNGNIQSEGNYEISSYIDCGPGGYQKMYYNYKVGNWKYYNALNIVEASGNYTNFNSHIQTNCGGTDLIFMKTNNEWIFPQGLDDNIKERVNSVLFSDGYNENSFSLKEDNTVEWKFLK